MSTYEFFAVDNQPSRILFEAETPRAAYEAMVEQYRGVEHDADSMTISEPDEIRGFWYFTASWTFEGSPVTESVQMVLVEDES